MAKEEPGTGPLQSNLPLDVADMLADECIGPQTMHGEPLSKNALIVPEASAELLTEVGDQSVGDAGGFDYSAVPEELAREMEATVVRIQDRNQKDFVATGEDLLRIKKQLDYGQWLPWVRDKFWFSVSTAERMIGWATLASINSSAVTNLKPAVVNTIAPKSTPVEIRDRILAAGEAREPVSAEEVRQEIRQHKEAARVAKRQKRLSTAELGREAQRKKRHERQLRAEEDQRRREEDQRLQERERRQQVAEQIADLLVEQVPDLSELVELFDASDARRCAFVGLLRERSMTISRAPHVPPPPARPAAATTSRDGEVILITNGRGNGAEALQSTAPASVDRSD